MFTKITGESVCAVALIATQAMQMLGSSSREITASQSRTNSCAIFPIVGRIKLLGATEFQVGSNDMKALVAAVYRAVMEFYDDAKRWSVDFVKFTIDFDERGHVVAITYTPIPDEHEDALLARVREVCEPHGRRFRGKLANVVVGFKNPSRN